MPVYYGAITLTIVSNLMYHLCAKKIESDINPFLALAVTYAVSMVVSVVAMFIFGFENGLREHLPRLNWACFVLGASIVFLEFGFILAYRVGWNISLAALYSNVAVGILLLPVGLIFFGEALTTTQIVGLVLSLAGLVLLSR